MAVSWPVRRPRGAGAPQVDDELIQVVTGAVRSLTVTEPSWRYASLSLCVLDAVFSPGARYESVRRLVDGYAEWACIAPPRVPRTLRSAEHEQGIAVFTRQVRELGPDRFADEVLGNRQRTYRSQQAPLKAAAALEFAERLLDAGVHTKAHLARLHADEAALARLDESLATVPGHGSGQRLDYFHLLAGDDNRVVPTRYLLAWLKRATGSDVTRATAVDLVRKAAAEMGVTPAAIGNAVWAARGELCDPAPTPESSADVP